MHPIAFIGATEMIWIAVILIVLFGARKLPELAHAMGSSLTQFKKGMRDAPELPEADEDDSDGRADKRKTP